MKLLKYVPSKSHQVIELDGEVTYVGTANELRSRSWAYELGYKDIYSLRRIAREVSVELATTYEEADRLRRVFDADVAAKEPGLLVFNDEWKQRALVLASEPEVIFGGELSTTLTIVLLDGAWWRLREVPFYSEEDSGQTGDDLDYSHDYPHDYARPSKASSIESVTLTPSPVHIVIYGSATNPYIVAGGNRYQVNATIPSGAYLTIDGKEKTIIMTGVDGSKTNLFSAGVRGSGEGGGTYIFEPVQPGVQNVSWDNSFGFDFGWYEEEGEPPWQDALR